MTLKGVVLGLVMTTKVTNTPSTVLLSAKRNRTRPLEQRFLCAKKPHSLLMKAPHLYYHIFFVTETQRIEFLYRTGSTQYANLHVEIC